MNIWTRFVAKSTSVVLMIKHIIFYIIMKSIAHELRTTLGFAHVIKDLYRLLFAISKFKMKKDNPATLNYED